MLVLAVPAVEQHSDHTCGVAALTSLLRAYGERVDENELAVRLEADEDSGVTARQLVREAGRRGFLVEPVEGMTLARLAAEIDAGFPVLLVLQAWDQKGGTYRRMWGAGHYVVAAGHAGGRFCFVDPSWATGHFWLDGEELLQRWHAPDSGSRLARWGLVLRRPDGAAGVGRIEVDDADLLPMP